MNQALGMVEVKGLVAAIQVADTMAKVAAVHIEKAVKTKGAGWMTVLITGDVGAVQAAVQAGELVAREKGLLVSVKVIPRVADGVMDVFLGNNEEEIKEEKLEKAEEIVIEVVEEKEVKEIVEIEAAVVEKEVEKKEATETKKMKKNEAKKEQSKKNKNKKD